ACKGKRVLEAGSGTGLLASYIEDSGAAKVLCCEQDASLASLSQQILSLKTKIFVKDVRQLDLAVPPQVIVHELFDSGLLGEGVLHLLHPLLQKQKEGGTEGGPLPQLLPARARVYGQLLSLRFEEVQGVNVTLLNPYRFQPDYHSSPCHLDDYTKTLSAPFLIEDIDFSKASPSDPPKALNMGVIRASEDGIISAVRLWFILAFGDEDKDEDEEGGEEGTEDEEGTEGEDEDPPCPSSGGRREGGRKGETVLDSRETHWKYAVSYLPEASFKKGERVPLMCIRSGAAYAFRIPQDLLQDKLYPTPRSDIKWVQAQEALHKKTQDILARVTMTRKEEAAAIVKAAYRIATHPAEFGVDPLMASRLFHSVFAAKRHAQPTRK
ncbi:hypothetical protein VYU27_009792, partial [Nannochloropsis oceanica]